MLYEKQEMPNGAGSAGGEGERGPNRVFSVGSLSTFFGGAMRRTHVLPGCRTKLSTVDSVPVVLGHKSSRVRPSEAGAFGETVC